MRTTHKAELRLCLFVLPDDGVAVIDAFKLCIVDNVNLCVLFYERLAEFNRLRSKIFNVIKSDRTV